MEDPKIGPANPRVSRWTNFTLGQAQEEAAKRDIHGVQPAPSYSSSRQKKASISPLTSSFKPNTSSISHLPAGDVTPSENKFDELESISSTHAVNSKTPSLSDKLQKTESSAYTGHTDRSSKLSSMILDSAAVSRYASESDSSDGDEDDTDIRNNVSNELGDLDIASGDIAAIAKELEELKTKMVTPREPPLHGSHNGRVQQRVLQFRDLKDEEVDSPIMKNDMMGVSVRLQHEELVSEWNSIRLRFSNYASENLKYLKVFTLAGVLGSLRRFPISSAKGGVVGKHNKDRFLADLWYGEHDALFGSAKTHQHEAAEDADLYSLQTANLPAMARNVSLRY